MYYFFNNKLINLGYHDTSGILFFHGIPGFLGGILTTIFVSNIGRLVGLDESIKNDTAIKYLWFIDELIPKSNNYKDLYRYNISFSSRAGIQFGSIFLTIIIAAASGFLSGFFIKFCKCEISKKYFNDSEFFDVTDNSPFPWVDEKVSVVYKTRENKENKD